MDDLQEKVVSFVYDECLVLNRKVLNYVKSLTDSDDKVIELLFNANDFHLTIAMVPIIFLMQEKDLDDEWLRIFIETAVKRATDITQDLKIGMCLKEVMQKKQREGE